MEALNILLEITIYSGILFCSIMLLKRCFRNRMSPFLHFAVWGLLIVRLMIPVTVESSVHLFVLPAEAQNATAQEQNPLPVLDSDAIPNADISGAVQPQTDVNRSQQAQSAVTPATVADNVPAVQQPLIFSTQGILLAVWLTGAGIGLLYLAILYVILRKRIRANAQPPSKRLLELFDEVKAELNIKRKVRIIGQCEYGTPAVLFPKTVLMPVSTLVSMSDEQVKYVLRHELMHFRRGDHFMSLLLSLLNAVYWFNPIVWIAFRLIRADMETACDSDVVRHFSSDEKSTYAAVILSLFSKKQYGNLVLGMVQGDTKKIAEKRIRGVFMHRRTNRRVKTMAVIFTTMLLFTCFTTACQPTPENAIVENKGDDDLDKAIMQTADSSTDGSQYISISDTRTNDTGTITININADVLLPDDDKITVARLERGSFTQEQVDAMIQVFFGNNLTFYDPLITTKEDIQASILILKQRLTDEEALLNSDYAREEGITDLDVIRAHVNERIEELQKQYEDAPAEAPVITDLDIAAKWINADVDFGRDYIGHVDYIESLSSRQSFSCYAFGDENNRVLQYNTSTQIDTNSDDPEFISAKQAAQKLIDDMGIEGVRMGDVFVSLDNTGNTDLEGKTTLASDRQFYVFCFERIVGDRTIDFSFYDGTYTGDDEVTVTVPYEQIQVWVDGDQVVKFSWLNPLTITEIVNDNTAVQIGYEEALDSAVNQIYYTYGNFESGYVESTSVEITSIEFDIVRLKEKNANTYISVPVWKFYGDIILNDTTGNSMSLTSDSGPNIVTVNALDGTIIDMQKGY